MNMLYFLLLIILFIGLYQIKVNVILYNELEIIETYHFISIIEAIGIYFKFHTFLKVGIYFSVKRYIDKINSFKNKGAK